jgi:superfamily I DNA/RNA helicase
MIEFNHFHGFCKNYLNENDIKWPDDIGYTSDEFLSLVVPQTVIDEKKKGKNRKSREYDAILIDEGQDFEKLWYDMLCLFLNKNDELLLVIDEKQNIYSRDISWVDTMNGTKFRGRWRILKESYRIPYLLLEKVNLFAEQYLPNIGSTPIPNSYQTDFFDPHYIWRNLNGTSIVDKVDSAFNWLTRKKGIHPQDIIILLPTHQVGWSLVKYFNEKKIQVNHVFEDDTNDHQHKRSFWMGDSRLKMSTFHSFKGWELMNVILIIPPDGSGSEPDLDSLIYTSLTRTRSNLIVFNRHSKYVEYGNTWPETW